MCADSAYGSEAMFKLGCGAIAPTRDGNEPRAIAIRLPLGGAPILTTAVFAGAVFQSKKALAQRVPVLEQGLRQMVLEAAQLAHQEQVVSCGWSCQASVARISGDAGGYHGSMRA